MPPLASLQMRLTEIQIAQRTKADPAFDTEASDTEVAPHLAAFNQVSVSSSVYHDCLPATVEAEFCPGRGLSWGEVMFNTHPVTETGEEHSCREEHSCPFGGADDARTHC